MIPEKPFGRGRYHVTTDELDKMVAIFKSNATTHDWLESSIPKYWASYNPGIVAYKCRKCGAQSFTGGNCPAQYYVSCERAMMSRALK